MILPQADSPLGFLRNSKASYHLFCCMDLTALWLLEASLAGLFLLFKYLHWDISVLLHIYDTVGYIGLKSSTNITCTTTWMLNLRDVTPWAIASTRISKVMQCAHLAWFSIVLWIQTATLTPFNPFQTVYPFHPLIWSWGQRIVPAQNLQMLPEHWRNVNLYGKSNPGNVFLLSGDPAQFLKYLFRVAMM